MYLQCVQSVCVRIHGLLILQVNDTSNKIIIQALNVIYGIQWAQKDEHSQKHPNHE